LGERVRVRGRKSNPDCLQYALDVVEDFVVPEPQHLIPLGSKPLFASSILRAVQMLTAIQFYDQPVFKVDKIHNISANGLLAAKLETFYLPISETLP
jgi:hypothetical protein